MNSEYQKIAIQGGVAALVALALFVGLWLTSQYVSAQSITVEACQNPQDATERRLCEELERLTEEERIVEASLQQQQQQSASIQRDLNILTDQVRQAQLSIDKKNIAIQQLGQDISLKEQTVAQLNAKMDRSKKALAEIIKRTNQLDETSVMELVLAGDNFSDFFVSIDNYNTLQSSLEALFDEIRDIRGLTEEEKEKLRLRQDQEQDVKYEIEQEKKTIEVKEDEKEGLLSVSKQSEATYASILAEKRQRASQIRAALFQLRDSAGISFGDAVRYAQIASKATGVRAALILGVLKQESDIGKNVGTCNRAGDPANKKWNQIMPGPLHYANYLANGGSCTGAASPCSWRDDQTKFKRIAGALGRDYETTPLSCPIASVGGWGGAMGPSQFIPTTWESYEGRIAQAMGVSTPDPWNPEHAFTATAFYLADLGAAYGGYTAEHTAAAKYYAGNNYTTSYGQSYGTSVLQHATQMQQQIDFLDEVDNE